MLDLKKNQNLCTI